MSQSQQFSRSMSFDPKSRLLGQGRIFTLAAIETIRKMADQGKTASEIADVIGSTAGSVRVNCSQLKIKLTRRGRPSVQRNKPNHIQGQRLILYVRPAAYSALNRKAAHMQKSPVDLAGFLLETIINDDLFEAVLDDGDSNPQPRVRHGA